MRAGVRAKWKRRVSRTGELDSQTPTPTTSTKTFDQTRGCKSIPIPSPGFTDFTDLEPLLSTSYADVNDQTNYLQYLKDSVSQSPNLNSTASI